MSLETWKREFYPITAKQAARKGALAAAEHSLKKWEGLRPAALKRHGVRVVCGDLLSGTERFGTTSDTCSLCEKFYGKTPVDPCRSCPLFETLGQPCCGGWDEERDRSPYAIWLNRADPKPMIRALRRTVNRLRRLGRA